MFARVVENCNFAFRDIRLLDSLLLCRIFYNLYYCLIYEVFVI